MASRDTGGKFVGPKEDSKNTSYTTPSKTQKLEAARRCRWGKVTFEEALQLLQGDEELDEIVYDAT